MRGVMKIEDEATVRRIADPLSEYDGETTDLKAICRVLVYLLEEKQAEDSYEQEQMEKL